MERNKIERQWEASSIIDSPVVHPDDAAIVRQALEEWGGSALSRPFSNVNRVYILHRPEEDWDVVIKTPGDSKEANPAYEAEVLKLVSEIPDPPLVLPKLLHYDKDTGTRLMVAIPGYVENHHSIWHAPPHRLEAMGRKFGRYVAWLGSIDPDMFKARTSSLSPAKTDWEELIHQKLTDIPNLEELPFVRNLIRSKRAQLYEQYPNGVQAADTKIIHEDFRFNNIVFQSLGEPVGAIDLETVWLGDPARMIRHLYSSTDSMLQGCLDEYQQQTGQYLSEARVRYWAITHPLIALCNQLQQGIPKVHIFVESASRLIELHSKEDWSELYRAFVRVYRPKEGWEQFDVGPLVDAAESLGMDHHPSQKVLSPAEEKYVLLFGGTGLLFEDTGWDTRQLPKGTITPNEF